MKYFISDYHFFHQNIFKYEPIRQQFGEKFINEMIKRYNSVVTENDVVYMVGDIFCGFNQMKKAYNLKRTEKEYAKAIMSKLPGKKILIRGNHDRKSDSWYKDIGFADVQVIEEVDGFLVAHYPICEKYIYDINENYRPYFKEALALKQQHNIPVIHGHIHSNKLYGCPNHFNVSCEVLDFTPISIEEIKRRMNESKN